MRTGCCDKEIQQPLSGLRNIEVSFLVMICSRYCEAPPRPQLRTEVPFPQVLGAGMAVEGPELHPSLRNALNQRELPHQVMPSCQGGLHPRTGRCGVQGSRPTPLSPSGTTLKGHPSSRASPWFTWISCPSSLWFNFYPATHRFCS